MHPQILVDPQRIECRCIKTRQEHIDDNQQIQLPILHPQGYVLVIILEFIARRIV